MWSIVYLMVFLTGGALSLLLTFLAGITAKKTGVMDIPSSRKIHGKPVPLLGGLGIYLSFFLTITAGIAAVKFGLIPSALMPHVPGIATAVKRLTVIMAGGLIVVGFGLIDDIRGVKPLQKLLLQAAAAIILFAGGIRITFFMPTVFHSFVLTLAWLILIMNSFNLMDNMDGLSAGVAFIIGLILFICALQMEHLFIAAILAVFLGSLTGFLRYNLPPAKIFMGECGSSFIGYFLATSAILTTYYRYEESQTFLPVFTPLIIFSILFFDTSSVVWIRIKKKLPVFKADKNHLSHRLVNLGMSKKQAVMFIYLLTLCTGIGALLLKGLNIYGGILVLIQVFIVISLVSILESVGRDKIREQKNTGPSTH